MIIAILAIILYLIGALLVFVGMGILIACLAGLMFAMAETSTKSDR